LPDAAGDGAGKSAFFMAKQFTFYQVARDGRHVDGHKGLFLPVGMVMNGLGYHFLSRARFAIDGYGDIVWVAFSFMPNTFCMHRWLPIMVVEKSYLRFTSVRRFSTSCLSPLNFVRCWIRSRGGLCIIVFYDVVESAVFEQVDGRGHVFLAEMMMTWMSFVEFLIFASTSAPS